MLAGPLDMLVSGWMDKWVDRQQKLEGRKVQWMDGDKQMLETEMIVQTGAPLRATAFFCSPFYLQSGTQQALSKAWFVAFAYFHSVNTSIMVNFELQLGGSKQKQLVWVGLGTALLGAQSGHQEERAGALH